MTEQQIEDGYRRLDGALAAPPDALVRVERRMATRRRRRRRTTFAGVGALGVVAVAGVAVAALSGDGDEPQVAVDPGSSNSTLVLTRPDGSTETFPHVTVSCDPPPAAAGDPVDPGSGRIWMWSPMDFSGTEDGDDLELHEPFVYVEGSVRRISGDRTFALSDDWTRASEDLPMIVFAADPSQEVDGRWNESSSQQSGTTGTVHVLEAACEPVPVLRLEVDATLGSEVGGPPLVLRGMAG